MADRPSLTSWVASDLRLPAAIAAVASVLLVLAVGVWAQGTQISGAVIASGETVVRGKPKKVQSYDGGIAEEILVTDGDAVTAGEVLLRLDPTLLQINLDILRQRLAEARVRHSRLQAEQTGRATIAFDYDTDYLDGLALSTIEDGQREIFEARREVLRGRSEQLRERIKQFGNRIAGIEAVMDSKHDQLGFIERELDNTRALNAQGLAREAAVMELQRAQARLLGEIAEHHSELAGLRNSIRDTEMEILQGERQFKEQVVTELREVTTAAEELVLQIVTARRQLERIEITAPVAGIVHEMQVTTIGGVVPAGETIMEIIPQSGGVDFEVRIDPGSIDQVFVGQVAQVRFPAFSRSTTPQVFGTVVAVSPSSVIDPATRQGFYRAQLEIPPEEIAKLGEVRLIPGMPMEAFLQTGERSVLSYIIRPLADQFSRAFRDT